MPTPVMPTLNSAVQTPAQGRDGQHLPNLRTTTAPNPDPAPSLAAAVPSGRMTGRDTHHAAHRSGGTPAFADALPSRRMTSRDTHHAAHRSGDAPTSLMPFRPSQ
ncbi:hypothetical protein BDW27_1252 [Nocardiopsis sp. L17-MgMaSL7]|nr:hypothetical protein BDW27_1252 [Nocardiopsis sp. L17-MgMaSL7]